VPDEVAAAPRAAVARLAEQLQVDPDQVRSYGRRAKTRTEHLRLVAQYLGWRAPTTLELKELDEFLLVRAMEHDSPLLLFRLACEYLISARVIRPGPVTVVERVAHAREEAQRETYDRLAHEFTEGAERHRRPQGPGECAGRVRAGPLAWLPGHCGEGRERHRLPALLGAVRPAGVARRAAHGDVFVPGSRRYSDPATYLLTPSKWADHRVEFCRLVGKPVDADTALAQVTDELHTALGELEATLAGGDGCFTHAGGKQARGSELKRNLIAVLIAQATNLGLTRMADARGISYDVLSWTAEWYVREEALRAENLAITDYHGTLPLTPIFDTGTLSSSDG